MRRIRESANDADQDQDRGQVAVLLVMVVLLTLLLLVGFGLFAQAMVHRARARSAADAIALAAASDATEANSLATWYQDQGVVATTHNGQSLAASGPSQAASRAEQTLTEVSVAPALVAIVARAEQLVGLPINPVRWHGVTVEVGLPDSDRLSLVAGELGLCVSGVPSAAPENTVYELC